jgi:hypothetical protein
MLMGRPGMLLGFLHSSTVTNNMDEVSTFFLVFSDRLDENMKAPLSSYF